MKPSLCPVLLILVAASGMLRVLPAQAGTSPGMTHLLGPVAPAAAFGEVVDVEALQDKAAHGDADALNDLGIVYAQGHLVRRDYRLAARCFHRAAYAGYPPAMANLGFMLESGAAGHRDYREAYAWLLVAVSLGVADRDHDVTVFRMGMLAERLGRRKVVLAGERAQDIYAALVRTAGAPPFTTITAQSGN